MAPQGITSTLGALTLKNGFDTDRRIVIATPWDHFGTTSGQFWVPKIGPKAHWITVEGVYPQSLISNTPYTVLKDFGIQRPPQLGPKSIKNRFQNGTARDKINVGGFDTQNGFHSWGHLGT